MEKNVYVWAVATFVEHTTSDGKESKQPLYWYKAIRLNDRSELISQIKLHGADGIHLTGSKKKAEKLAELWNTWAKKNGNAW